MSLKNARELDVQPEDIEPVFSTHFDCWTDDGTEDGKPIPHDSNEAAALADELAGGWADDLSSTGRIPASELNHLRGFTAMFYKTVGQVGFFAALTRAFVAVGFSVYNGDEFFEVYSAQPVNDQGEEGGITLDTRRCIYVCTDTENGSIKVLLPKGVKLEVVHLNVSNPDPENTDAAEAKLLTEEMEEHQALTFNKQR